jgi:hypothetical protein
VTRRPQRGAAGALSALALALAGPALAACGGAGHGPSAPAKPPRPGAGIPASLLAGLRTVGAGERFHPAARGPIIGTCRPRLGARIAAHVELFAENHVVLIAGGVGTAAPRTVVDARITRARCFGAVVTLDPTGIVYARPGAAPTLADLFRSWGEPLSATRLASFVAPPGTRVRVYVDGRSRGGPPELVPLSEHAEIVVEVGPRVPPHVHFTFPPAPEPAMP